MGTGKPFFEILGKENSLFLKERQIGKIHLSLSHEDEHSVAFVIAESMETEKK